MIYAIFFPDFLVFMPINRIHTPYKNATNYSTGFH